MDRLLISIFFASIPRYSITGDDFQAVLPNFREYVSDEDDDGAVRPMEMDGIEGGGAATRGIEVISEEELLASVRMHR